MHTADSDKDFVDLDFDAPMWCIHFRGPYDYNTAENMIASLCAAAGKSLAVARLPKPKSFRTQRFRRPSVFNWLAAATTMSLVDAKRVISSFPVHVSANFEENAMNPRRFLALAAAITQRADVLLYDTSGMDPLGISELHAYAIQYYIRGCLVHACWHPMINSCPNAGSCISMSAVHTKKS